MAATLAFSFLYLSSYVVQYMYRRDTIPSSWYSRTERCLTLGHFCPWVHRCKIDHVLSDDSIALEILATISVLYYRIYIRIYIRTIAR